MGLQRRTCLLKLEVCPTDFPSAFAVNDERNRRSLHSQEYDSIENGRPISHKDLDTETI